MTDAWTLPSSPSLFVPPSASSLPSSILVPSSLIHRRRHPQQIDSGVRGSEVGGERGDGIQPSGSVHHQVKRSTPSHSALSGHTHSMRWTI